MSVSYHFETSHVKLRTRLDSIRLLGFPMLSIQTWISSSTVSRIRATRRNKKSGARGTRHLLTSGCLHSSAHISRLWSLWNRMRRGSTSNRYTKHGRRCPHDILDGVQFWPGTGSSNQTNFHAARCLIFQSMSARDVLTDCLSGMSSTIVSARLHFLFCRSLE